MKELTRSLEASLNNRGGIKKPAGAIDLHHAEDDEDEDGQQHNDNKNVEKPKRSVSFRDVSAEYVPSFPVSSPFLRNTRFFKRTILLQKHKAQTGKLRTIYVRLESHHVKVKSSFINSLV